MKQLNENRIIFETREEWRTWLKKNHGTKKQVSLVYYKKHTGKKSVRYEEAVEEALCFGWIDSKINRIDDEMYMQLFTPRKPNSVWSLLNKKRVEKLIKEGKMTASGFLMVEAAKETGRWNQAYGGNKKCDVPADLQRALKNNKEASKNFRKFSSGYQRRYIEWISMAKRNETREKRILQVVKFALGNKKPGF